MIGSSAVMVGMLLSVFATGRSEPDPVVMIAIDGLRPDQLTSPASREWNVPVLRGLSRDGATAVGVRGVLPTLTLPSMATLVTGTSPDAHGVVNNIRCGADARQDGEYYWYASDVNVETLWDAARRAGMRTANVGWTSTVGASIDRNSPEVFHGKIDADQRARDAMMPIDLHTAHDSLPCSSKI